jgi:type II secretory pathway component GspD/PulD (secretin)
MSFVQRIVTIGAAATLLAHPANAQRGASGRPATPSKAQAAKADSAKKAAAGVALDFQDQELKVVLDALAAAGELNVSMTNIPSQRVSVHMGRPVTRDGMVDLVKNVAESNGLKVTETPTLIQIAGTPPPPPEARQTAAQQLLAQQIAQNQQQQVRLYTYRLKHASAVQLAPVLTNLFAGTGTTFGRAATTIVPNANGGFQVFTPGNAAGGPPGNITTIPAPFANPNAGRGGGGRGAAAAAAAANPNVGGNVAQAINQAFAQAAGLSGQSGDIRIIAEESSNALLIRATESDWALVQQVIQGVDLRPLQVLIEVTIAEVQRTHDFDLGVSGNVKQTAKGKNGTNITGTAPSQASDRAFIVELTGGNGTINYDVAMAALQARGDVRVLSLPVIIAQNNRQAVLNVGSSRPFVQVSQTVPNDPTGRVQTVQYIDVATTLTITPTINPDGYVNLQVSQTDNSATNEVQFDAPVINKREATTQIFIRDGQTTVIGGLADNSRSHDVSGIPFLSRIPVVGPFLFGRVTQNETANELFLFLTPHIISNDGDVDKLRDALRDGSDLLRTLYFGPRIIPRADTLPPFMKPDTLNKPDSLTTLRRRPPDPR